MIKRLFIISVLALGIGLVSCQRRPGPNPPALPPFKAPLLPPVPSQEFVDRLTKQQLAFIRLHQKIQQNDKTSYSPYACLPKYICIVDDENGKKRTAVVNGLHPALRGGAPRSPVKNEQEEEPVYLPNIHDLSLSDPDAFYKNQIRLSNDEFLRNQELAEEKVLDGQQKPKHHNRDRDEAFGHEKQQEASKEDSVEDSNESNEENSSKSRESVEQVNHHGPHPPSAGGPHQLSSQGAAGQYESSRPGEVNGDFHFGNPVASVPWDDRPKNYTKSSGGLVAKIKSVLPVRSIPFINNPFSSGRKEPFHEPTTTTQRSILRRMLGGGQKLFRGKRQADKQKSKKKPFMTKLGPGIKSTDQCRVLYNGCDLNYDEVMQIAQDGQVLIEGDDPYPSNKPTPPTLYVEEPNKAEDDEFEQAMKDKLHQQIATLNNNILQHGATFVVKPSGTGFYKVKNSKGSKYGSGQSDFNTKKKKPISSKPEEDESDTIPVGSLPVLPMRFTWGRPQYYVNGKPQYPDIYGIDSRNPTTPSTPSPPIREPSPTPIFVKKPVFSKMNRTITQTNIIKLNSTHALQIKSPKTKPYRPDKATVLDSNGNPASFASVFTEIAGSSGGIHDYFDKISKTVGGPPTRRVQKQFPRPVIPPPTPPPDAQGDDKSSEEDDAPQNDEGNNGQDGQDDDASDEEEEEDEPEQDVQEGSQQQSDDNDDDDVETGSDEPQDEETELFSIKPKKFKYKIKSKPKNKRNPNKHNKVSQKNKDKEVEEQDDEEQDDDPENIEGQYDSPQDDVEGQEPDDNNQNDEPQDDEGAENDDIPDTSEEKRKRIKAAEEVELPEFLPEQVKQAIKQDIINGGKKKKGQEEGQGMQPPGGPQPLNDDDSSGEFEGQGERPLQGPPQGGPQGGGGPGAYGSFRPQRPGLFSSLFGRH